MFQLNRNHSKLKGAQSADQKIPKLAQKPALVDDDLPEIKELIRWNEENKQKISKLLDKIKQNFNGVLIPQIDHNKGAVHYPALGEIGELTTNPVFLEKLSHRKLGFLEKFVYNQFLICPDHRASFLLNVRLCCPKCNSIDVHKLHLFEHKICGCIMEKPKFVDAQEADKLKCPSCNRVIKNPQKELRSPAMWYFCNDCKEKFDEVLINFHCKEFDHDFTINDAQTVTVCGYALTDGSEHSPLDYQELKSEISRVLSKLGFSVDENYTIKGKSGHDHKIDIYGSNNKNQTAFILVNDSNDSEIDSKIIQILDTSPKIALIIGAASVNEKTKAIASKYNVSIISSQNMSEIVSEAEKILTYRLQKLDGVQLR
ncbi:MAG TPA: hypothetical protein VGA92_03010 [Candidatus Nitrosotenuis sp.]